MDYRATIETTAPAAEAAKRIFDDLEGWWAVRTERTDTGFTVRFNNSHASFAVDPGATPQEFGWTCTDAHMIIEDVPDPREWVGTRLLWSIAPTDTGCAVTMTHQGLGPQIDCFDVCTRGWQHFFEVSLKALLDGDPAAPSMT